LEKLNQTNLENKSLKENLKKKDLLIFELQELNKVKHSESKHQFPTLEELMTENIDSFFGNNNILSSFQTNDNGFSSYNIDDNIPSHNKA
jgi:hypothetical protein